MYVYNFTSKHNCNISTYWFFQLLSNNRNPDESKGKFLAPPKMAGASSVTDTCCLEAMTRCSEIPKKVLKKSLKHLSNASKSKVGALNVTFFYVF